MTMEKKTEKRTKSEIREENRLRMLAILEPLAKEYGFDTCELEINNFKRFSVKWKRSYRWIEFSVSDYLEEAPDDVVRNIIECLLKRIMGKTDAVYVENTLEWLNSEEFLEINQPKFASRIKLDRRADNSRLYESIERLKEKGLIPDTEGMLFGWTRNYTNKSYEASLLMKTAVFSRRLLEEEVPDRILDYVMFRSVKFMDRDYSNSLMSPAEFDEWIQDYPEKEEIEVE